MQSQEIYVALKFKIRDSYLSVGLCKEERFSGFTLSVLEAIRCSWILHKVQDTFSEAQESVN